MAGKNKRYRQKERLLIIFLSVVFLSVFFVHLLTVSITREKNDGEILDDIRPEYVEEILPESDNRGVAEIEPCQENRELYLGIYGERIAVYSRDGEGNITLEEVLPYLVKIVDYEELARGIPFSTTEEKLLILENLTS